MTLLIAARARIARPGVTHDYGYELPDDLGLDPNQLFKIYISPGVLIDAAESFCAVPLLNDIHCPIVDPNFAYQRVIGCTGPKVLYLDGYLVTKLSVWHPEGIHLIRSGTALGLSIGYAHDVDMTPGELPTGDTYDGIVTRIYGSHVSLAVENQPAWPNCQIQPETVK
jgi:hypothetical protein